MSWTNLAAAGLNAFGKKSGGGSAPVVSGAGSSSGGNIIGGMNVPAYPFGSWPLGSGGESQYTNGGLSYSQYYPTNTNYNQNQNFGFDDEMLRGAVLALGIALIAKRFKQ